MSAETANLLRTELETSDRLRRNWIETQTLLHAAAARLEQQGKELDEARAELREAVSEGIDDRLLAASYQEECANLRAAVEKCNGELGCTAYALLAPSAAPAASEPNRSHATTATKDLSAEAGAGPKRDFCCIDALDAARASAWKDRNVGCGCDHNESCAECFPPAFHLGGYWDQQRASLQQSTAGAGPKPTESQHWFRCEFCHALAPPGKHVCGDMWTERAGIQQLTSLPEDGK